jgi:NodT family efflux transporter outer membrane factor (OMF) lipoprotein
MIGLSGCAPKLPPVPTPREAVAAPNTFEAEGPSSTDSTEVPTAPLPWAQWVEEPALRALIGEALVGGFDLRLASHELVRAHAGLRAASARRFPSLGGRAGGDLRRFPERTADGAGYRGQPIDGRPPPSVYPELGFGLEASWEVSAWGALRHARGAAQVRALASAAAVELVSVTVVSEVAAAWYELMALDQTVASLEAAAARRAQVVGVVEAQSRAARSDAWALAQVSAAAAAARADLQAAQQLRAEQELTINRMLGRMPAPVARAEGALSRPPVPPAAGVPAEVLRRRPDVRAAERSLLAAGLDLKAARAAFFPTIDLRGDVGLASFQAGTLLAPEAVGIGVGAGLLGPLINRGGLQADFARARSAQLDALVEYERTLVHSVTEVQGHLSGLSRASAQVEHRRAQQAASAQAVSAAAALFASGRANTADVLIAEEALLEADRALVAAELERCLRAIALYRALAGGWAPIASPTPGDAEGGATGP